MSEFHHKTPKMAAQREILTRENTGLEALPDIEIIEKMGLGDIDRKRSAEAFAEFHRRYAKTLYTTCYYICRMMPNQSEAAADISENVLIRAFAYANSFNPNRASIKTWLNSIAQNEFNDYYTDFRINHPPQEEQTVEKGVPELVIEDEMLIDRTKINGAQMELALGSLTPMERDIVITHMMHKDIDNLDSQIPGSVMADLSKAYKKKPQTIRKIKSRAMNKIKSFILKE
jgi:RNA polymerase sigma factor (sigma-70 family)